jgi:hypothetical protein
LADHKLADHRMAGFSFVTTDHGVFGDNRLATDG